MKLLSLVARRWRSLSACLLMWHVHSAFQVASSSREAWWCCWPTAHIDRIVRSFQYGQSSLSTLSYSCHTSHTGVSALATCFSYRYCQIKLIEYCILTWVLRVTAKNRERWINWQQLKRGVNWTAPERNVTWRKDIFALYRRNNRTPGLFVTKSDKGKGSQSASRLAARLSIDPFSCSGVTFLSLG